MSAHGGSPRQHDSDPAELTRDGDSNRLTVARGERSVSIAGNASEATIVTGDNNQVVIQHPSGEASVALSLRTWRPWLAMQMQPRRWPARIVSVVLVCGAAAALYQAVAPLVAPRLARVGPMPGATLNVAGADFGAIDSQSQESAQAPSRVGPAILQTTPSPTAVASPTPTATPNGHDAWVATLAKLNPVWHQDWKTPIALIEDYRRNYPDAAGRYPTDAAEANGKEYAALLADAGSLLSRGRTADAVTQLERAQDLASGTEAKSTLTALTPTPTPMATSTPYTFLKPIHGN